MKKIDMYLQNYFLSFLCLILLGGCVTNTSTHPETDIVGTWRFVSVNGKKVDDEFYVKYESDGIALTWPVPECWSNQVNGVSSGGYYFDDDYFYIVKANSADIKSKYRLYEDTLKLTTDEGYVLIYKRVENPPEPGELLATSK